MLSEATGEGDDPAAGDFGRNDDGIDNETEDSHVSSTSIGPGRFMPRMQFEALMERYRLMGYEAAPPTNTDFAFQSEPARLHAQQALDLHDAPIAAQIRRAALPLRPAQVSDLLRRRETRGAGAGAPGVGLSAAERISALAGRLPTEGRSVARFQHRVYCGLFSADGDKFVAATQGGSIVMFDARAAGRELVPARWIEARNIRWTITDLDLSPDGRFLAYSSIGSSSSANVCSIAGDSEQHERLAMYSQGESFAVYSVRWGGQREVVAGCNDCHLRAFDLERQTTTLDVNAHEDDVNACSIADGAFQSSVVVTGSDDATIKVWDRRMLGISGAAASPQGVLVGHTEGITFLSAKGDGRYMLSNSKDQSAKLWDLRALRSPAQAAALTPVPRRHRVWDYRRSEYPNVLGRNADGTPWPTPHHRHPDDTSLMTYRGHKVHYTLIRCHFSPAESTAHKFVYSGSADGRVHIYDTLTGEVEAVLVHGQDRRDVAAVRDVAWHPWQPLLCTAAWDGRVTRWDAQCEAGSLTARLRRGASAASRTAAGARPGGTAGASSEPTPTPCLREERACTSKEPTGGQKLSRVYKVLRDSDACESEVCARAPSCAPSDQARPDVLEMYVQLLLSTLSARSPRVLSQPVSAGLCGVPSCAAGNQRTWLLH